MTQIFNLPQIDGSQTSFIITKGAIFQFSIAFPFPAGPQTPLVASGAMTSGSATIQGLPPEIVASLVTGQGVAGYGVPTGTIIAAIPSTTSVVLSAFATQTSASAGLTFQPLPLDLSGISFVMQVRRSVDDAGVLLELSTDNGLLISGGSLGVLSCLVPPEPLSALPLAPSSAPLVTDIVVSAPDGGPINLMGLSGPASVIVLQGVTRS